MIIHVNFSVDHTVFKFNHFQIETNLFTHKYNDIITIIIQVKLTIILISE